MTTLGTLSAQVRVNLRMKTPLLGFRCWIAARIVSVAAFILGGKLTVDLEPEITMFDGTKAYGNVRL